MRICILFVLVASGFAQQPDQISENFRTAGLRAIRAIHNRVAGTDSLADRDAIRAIDEADVQRKTAADDRTFQQLKDYAAASEAARVEISNARLQAMIRARLRGTDKDLLNAASSVPETESSKLEKACNAELESILRSGSAKDDFSCSKKK